MSLRFLLGGFWVSGAGGVETSVCFRFWVCGAAAFCVMGRGLGSGVGCVVVVSGMGDVVGSGVGAVVVSGLGSVVVISGLGSVVVTDGRDVGGLMVTSSVGWSSGFVSSSHSWHVAGMARFRWVRGGGGADAGCWSAAGGDGGVGSSQASWLMANTFSRCRRGGGGDVSLRGDGRVEGGKRTVRKCDTTDSIFLPD